MARKILNVGTDPEQVKLRDKALVSAGYHVVSATNLLEVVKACERHDIDLAVLGHVLNVNEKSRITSFGAYVNATRPCWRSTKYRLLKQAMRMPLLQFKKAPIR